MTSFAARLVAMIDGRISPEALCAAEGPGGSAPADVGFYREMVRRQRRAVVDGFFAATRAAADSIAPGRWRREAESFVHDAPPRAWNPNAWALTFPAYLDRRGVLAFPVLRELVDFAVLRYRAMHAVHDAEPRIDEDLFVRLYQHEVTPYSERAEAGEGSGLPPVRATVLAVARSRASGRLVVCRASPATMQLLERRLLGVTRPGLDEGVLAGEEARLRAAGILPSRSDDRSRLPPDGSP